MYRETYVRVTIGLGNHDILEKKMLITDLLPTPRFQYSLHIISIMDRYR